MSGVRLGGSAFPTDRSPGMHLRDWFAGQALAGYLASIDAASHPDWPTVAEDVYNAADALVAAKESRLSDPE